MAGKLNIGQQNINSEQTPDIRVSSNSIVDLVKQDGVNDGPQTRKSMDSVKK